MKILLSLCLSITLLASASAQAQASNISCSGKVKNMYVYADGRVNVEFSWRSELMQVCQLSEHWKGVDPMVCSMWAATLSNAKQNKTTVKINYTGISGGSSCATLPVGTQSLRPAYIAEMETAQP